MRVIKARRGSDRVNHRIAEAIADRRDDHRPMSGATEESRALSATDRD